MPLEQHSQFSAATTASCTPTGRSRANRAPAPGTCCPCRHCHVHESSAAPAVRMSSTAPAVPAVGSSRPARNWMRVVFPGPSSPTTASISPGCAEKDTLACAVTWGYRLPRPCDYDGAGDGAADTSEVQAKIIFHSRAFLHDRATSVSDWRQWIRRLHLAEASDFAYSQVEPTGDEDSVPTTSSGRIGMPHGLGHRLETGANP